MSGIIAICAVIMALYSLCHKNVWFMLCLTLTLLWIEFSFVVETSVEPEDLRWMLFFVAALFFFGMVDIYRGIDKDV